MPSKSKRHGGVRRHAHRPRNDKRNASISKSEVEPHDQVEEPLCRLRGKVWPRLPPSSGPALLPQSLQGQLSCENSERACVHEKMARFPRSRYDVVSGSYFFPDVVTICRKPLAASASSALLHTKTKS